MEMHQIFDPPTVILSPFTSKSLRARVRGGVEQRLVIVKGLELFVTLSKDIFAGLRIIIWCAWGFHSVHEHRDRFVIYLI
jgi:hypothetical protein